MSIGNRVAAALAVSLLMVGLSACEKKEGPMERAGKELDKSVESVGQHIEKAGQDIKEAAKGDKK